MKKLITRLLLFMLPIIYGCSTTDEFPERKITRTATYKDLDLYMLIGSHDSQLVDYTFYDSTMCKKLVLSDDTLIEESSFLRKGRAEKEALQPMFAMHEDTLYVIENNGAEDGKLMKISLASSDNPDSWIVHDFPKKQNTGSAAAMAWAGDDRLALCLMSSGQPHFLYLYDMADEKYYDLNLNIEDGCDGERYWKSMMYSTNAGIFYSDTHHKLSYTCGEGRYFEIITLEDHKIKDRIVVFGDMPKYTSYDSGGGMWTYDLMDKKKRGIVSWGTDERIYLVYYAENISKDREDGFPGTFFDTIDVFDWNGRQVDRLKTDKPFSNFLVNEDDSRLYTFTIDLVTKEKEILEYTL